MEIRTVEVADDVALRAVYDIERRAALVGREGMPHWSWQEMSGNARRPDPGERVELFAGYADGRMVAEGAAFLGLLDNLDKCWVHVSVDPVAQGHGHGRELLDHLWTFVTDLGRTTVITETKLPFAEVADHGHRRFAEAAGFTLSNVEIVRHLELPVATADLARWSEQAAARSADYTIETYVNEIPDNLVPSLVVLIGQLGVDAPTGDVDWEEEVISPERFRENRASLVAAGRTLYETVAIAPDGTVAAQSTISVPPPGRTDVSQWGTFVHREHRGRRLGLAVKTANLRAVQQAHPQLTRVSTQNAETNAWMIAINEQLGYRPVEAAVELLRRL